MTASHVRNQRSCNQLCKIPASTQISLFAIVPDLLSVTTHNQCGNGPAVITHCTSPLNMGKLFSDSDS